MNMENWNYEDVLISLQSDGKGIITINKSESLNALDWTAMAHVKEAAQMLNADPRVRLIVVTGSGEKAFCAGGDLSAEVKMTDFSAYRWARLSQETGDEFSNSPKPTIAAINGYALGGGLELALACDFRICTEKAKLGTPETKVGVMCGGGGTYRLVKLIGEAKAMEFLMTSNMVDSEEALRLNLVNRIAPEGKLMETVDEFAVNLLNKGGISLEMTKKAVRNMGVLDYHTAADLEAAMFCSVATTNDKVEGMSAFLEKRTAQFTNS